MSGYQTMFDRDWSPNISCLNRACAFRLVNGESYMRGFVSGLAYSLAQFASLKNISKLKLGQVRSRQHDVAAKSRAAVGWLTD